MKKPFSIIKSMLCTFFTMTRSIRERKQMKGMLNENLVQIRTGDIKFAAAQYKPMSIRYEADHQLIKKCEPVWLNLDKIPFDKK